MKRRTHDIDGTPARPPHHCEDCKPRLTPEDWVEIWSALESKSMQLRNGDYGESDEDCDVDEWADHLDRIAEKIGEDGRNMYPEKGVPDERLHHKAKTKAQ